MSFDSKKLTVKQLRNALLHVNPEFKGSNLKKAGLVSEFNIIYCGSDQKLKKKLIEGIDNTRKTKDQMLSELKNKGFYSINITTLYSATYAEVKDMYDKLIKEDFNNPRYEMYRSDYSDCFRLYCSNCGFICCSNLFMGKINRPEDEKSINFDYKKYTKEFDIDLYMPNDYILCFSCDKWKNKFNQCLDVIKMNPHLERMNTILQNEEKEVENNFENFTNNILKNIH